MNILLVYPHCEEDMWCQNKSLKAIDKKYLGPPPMGLMTVAALLPTDWEVTLVDMNIRSITEEDWNRCDVVMLSGMTVHFSHMVAVLEEAKARGKIVVMGGALVFHGPDQALGLGADIVVKGEAEVVVDQLVAALERGDTGIVIEAHEKADMLESPVPRFDLIDLHQYLVMGVQTNRGCPFKCEFCDITIMFGRQVRNKSADQVLTELAHLYDLGWRGYVFFVDDNFIGHRPRAKEILRAVIPWMEERKHPFDFIMYASLDLAQDPEMIDLLVRAGCVKLLMGIESTDEDCLNASRKFQNTKHDIDTAVQIINEAGIQVLAHFMIGFDTESPGVDQRIIDFVTRNNIPEAPIMLLQVGPGTELWDRLEKEGRLLWDGPDDSLGTTTGLPKFVTQRPLEQIVAEYINVYETLYEPDAYLDRTFHHYARMRRRPQKKPFAIGPWAEIRNAPVFFHRHSGIYSSRWKFIKYAIRALIQFPDRFRDYIMTCAAGEQYASFRWVIKRKLLEQLAQRHEEEESKVVSHRR